MVAVEVPLIFVRRLRRFLEVAEEVQSVDKFFIGDFILILLPLLLYLQIESILSASTVYFLFHRQEIVDPALYFAGPHFALVE